MRLFPNRPSLSVSGQPGIPAVLTKKTGSAGQLTDRPEKMEAVKGGRRARMRAGAVLFLVLVLVLCSCGVQETGAGRRMKIYCLNEDKNGVAELGFVEVVHDGGDELPFAIGQVLVENWDSGHYGAFGDGVRLLSVTTDGYIATVDFSDEMNEMSGFELTRAAACIVLTAAQFDGGQRVRILAGGKPPAALANKLYTAEDFIGEPPAVVPVEHQVSLYFADAENKYLGEETRNVVIRENEAIETYIIDELLYGPKADGLVQAMPPGTKLLGCHVEEKICTVNLSAEFASPVSAAAARIAVLMIVNSLTSLDNIDAVMLTVDGRALFDYFGLDISEPLKYDGSAIDNGQDEADLYYLAAGGDMLVEIPSQLAHNDAESRDRRLMRALLSSEPPLGVTSPLPELTSLLGVYVMGGEIVVTVEYGGERPESEHLAIYSIVNTLTESNPEMGVRIIEGGSQSPVYYRDMSMVVR